MNYTQAQLLPFQRLYKLWLEVSDFVGINEVSQTVTDENRQALSDLEKAGLLEINKPISSSGNTYYLTDYGCDEIIKLQREGELKSNSL